MAKETKSAAELAREERKARIEKAGNAQAERKEKKENQSKAKKRAKWLVPTIIIVVALVIALLYYFGVPQRTTSVIKFDNGTKISVAEYEYYYKAIYNNIANTSYQYEQYYGAYYGEGAGKMMTGFDYAKTPKNQECTLKEADTGIKLDPKIYGDNPTWADFLKEYAIEQSKEITAVYNAAIKAGKSLTDKEKDDIDKQIEELRSTAAENNYSLNAYLMQTYGRGMNEKMLRKIMTKQTLASSFMQAKEAEFNAAVTEDDILNYYKENQNEYNKVSLRYFSFDAEPAKNVEAQEATDTSEAVEGTNYTDEELAAMTAETLAEKKADAESFYESASESNFDSLAYQYAEDDYKDYYDTDSDTYSETYTTAADVNYSSLESNFGKEIADWAYDSSREYGDKFMSTQKQDNGCTSFIIVVMSSLPTKDDTLQPVSARHILFSLTKDVEVEDEDGNKTTEKQDFRTMDEAVALAEETLDAWVESGAKEEDFIKLAAEKSDDEGSADNGGLYEDLTTSSSFTPNFLNWCFEDGRKVGDYGIIETEYGAHIMYMSYISDKPQWMQDIASALATNASDDFYSGIIGDKAYNGKLSNGLLTKVQNRNEKYAEKVVSNLKAQAEKAAAAQSVTAQ